LYHLILLKIGVFNQQFSPISAVLGLLFDCNIKDELNLKIATIIFYVPFVVLTHNTDRKSQMKILVVEDNEPIARMIERGLKSEGYDLVVADNGKSALDIVSQTNVSLIILDIMLPKLDGIQVCEMLRDRGNRVPILMLTARDTVEDRVRGLDVGADDYLSKPFAFPELSARVRALLRRDRVHRTKIIRVADLTIDTAQRLVTRAGETIGLSHREYELLEALAGHESQVLTREVILERIWMNDETYSNTVDVYINMLRKKIDAGHSVKLIQTVRGTGYTLRVPLETKT